MLSPELTWKTFHARYGEAVTRVLRQVRRRADQRARGVVQSGGRHLSPRVPRPLRDQLRTIRREAGTADRGAQSRAAEGDGRAAERIPERASERLGGRRGPAAGPHRRGRRAVRHSRGPSCPLDVPVLGGEPGNVHRAYPADSLSILVLLLAPCCASVRLYSVFCSLSPSPSDWPLVQRQDTRLWIWEWWFESTGAN